MTAMTFKHAQLDNGLTLIAEVTPSAQSMAVGFFARTGSRDETAEIAGVSHFLEHMVFKGTERRSASAVNLEFDEMGAHYNAFTSEENTVYYGAVLPEFQDRLLALLGDILRPALRQQDFDVEKNVILEEIAMYQDIPRYRLYDNLMSEHFAGHALGHSVLGANETIQALRREQMEDYFRRRYSPTNVTLVGVGNVDFDRLVDHARKLCGHWQPFEAKRDTTPAAASCAQRLIADPKVARQHLAMMSRGPAAQDDRRYAAMLAATILGDSTGSRLYYALVETALADEASTAYDSLDGDGAFITFLSCDSDKAARALDIARGELRRFLQDGPTAAELEAAKNKIATGATLKGEIPMGRLTAVGFDWVYRKEYSPLADQIEALFAVSDKDILDVVRQFDLCAATTVGLGPLDKLA